MCVCQGESTGRRKKSKRSTSGGEGIVINQMVNVNIPEWYNTDDSHFLQYDTFPTANKYSYFNFEKGSKKSFEILWHPLLLRQFTSKSMIKFLSKELLVEKL